MNPSEKQSQLSLLLIDDDAELCSMMAEFFAQMGHRLERAYNGREGLARALSNNYDLIVLDVKLPIVDGYSLLQHRRKRKEVPVIMLTARVGHRDRVQGLNAGADDYLAKLFDADELLARIRAVLRRTGKADTHVSDSVKTFGDIRVMMQAREVWDNGRLVDLTALEFDILALLIRSAGRIISREEITAIVLERAASPYDRALDVHISHLRSKLEHGRTVIRTVRGLTRLKLAVRLTRSAADPNLALDRVERETNRITLLVSEIVEMTRMEGDPHSRKMENVSLSQVVGETLDDCRVEAQLLRGCTIRVHGKLCSEVAGERELLRRAVENVVRNAIQYSEEHGSIDILLTENSHAATITIRDYGPGVPSEFLTQIFEPFYRVEEVRDEESGGIGLGLSIAKRAVRLHRGTITARNADPGLSVEIEIPTMPLPVLQSA